MLTRIEDDLFMYLRKNIKFVIFRASPQQLVKRPKEGRHVLSKAKINVYVLKILPSR